MNGIILFDGVCNLCTSTVTYIIKRDPHKKFKFASIQSEVGQRYLDEHSIEKNLDSFIFINTVQNKAYTKSTAALHVCKELSGSIRLLFPFIVLPRPIRDMIYMFIANNRYKWFGKKEECILPAPELNERFIN